MPDLEFTGERFLPGTPGGIAYEHWHRYAFALRYVAHKRVLDAACGEGYGTALLAGAAAAVTGIDIDAEAVRHARQTYAHLSNVRFASASVAELPLPDASMDVVVSYETIEHLPAPEQPRMLAEFARVLTPDGVLVLSSPNKLRYSDARDYRNPFHLHELYRDDLERLLDRHFTFRRWYHQVPLIASAIFSEERGTEGEAWASSQSGVAPAATPDGVYYIVVGARSEAVMTGPGAAISVLSDTAETELARAEHNAAEVLRLDALLREHNVHVRHLEELLANCEQTVMQRDGQLDQRRWHVQHLEGLLGNCERVVQERDAELATLRERSGQCEQTLRELRTNFTHAQAALASRDTELRELAVRNRELEAAISAQERIIAYRQTLLWWAQLPWVKARSWWQGRGT